MDTPDQLTGSAAGLPHLVDVSVTQAGVSGRIVSGVPAGEGVAGRPADGDRRILTLPKGWTLPKLSSTRANGKSMSTTFAKTEACIFKMMGNW